MKILAICGSTNPNSSNNQLLKGIKNILDGEHEVTIVDNLHEFDLFSIPRIQQGIPANIQAFKQQVIDTDAVIIASPEYSYNVPAVVKSAMEWCYESGEFHGKPTLPIVLMPNEPRGRGGMEGLVNTMKGQKANIIAEMPLFLTDLERNGDTLELKEETKELILGAVEMM